MNPFFQAMGGNRQPNMMQQFQQFMNQMKGKDPNAMIQEMVSSGRISQDQLNQVQKQAQQMQGMFEGMRGMFGKYPFLNQFLNHFKPFNQNPGRVLKINLQRR